MCSREPLLNAWVDHWYYTLVDKTLDMFWGNMVSNQVDLGEIPRVMMCDPLPFSRDGP
jgi:hypothetical protein